MIRVYHLKLTNTLTIRLCPIRESPVKGKIIY